MYASDPSPTASLGRYLRWQMGLALLGVVVLTALLGFAAYNVTTEYAPARGGVFREGVAGNPQYINPLLCQAHEVDQDLCKLLFRGLTRLDASGRAVPDLAESWSSTPDGLIYTFRLRAGLFWDDGQPVTIDDVLFTVQMMQAEDTVVVPDLAELWRSVDVERVDDRTVRFILDEPFAPFLDYTTVGLLPQHVWRDTPPSALTESPLNQTPVGNGPMRVVQSSAEMMRLESNPFSGMDAGYISALEFHFYPDYPSIYAAYLEGEIDGISRILPADLELAQRQEDLQFFSSLQSVFVTIVLNMDNPDIPFFQEKSVRQALYYGLDREQLVADAVQGQGVVADSPVPLINWAHADNLPQYGYDPDRASRLLEEAGWIDNDGDGVREKDGRPLQFILLANDDPIRIALIQQISAAWRQIGVDARPQQVSFAGLVNDFLAPRRFDAAVLTWSITGDPDPFPLWHSSQAEEGGQNYSAWKNEAADQIMEQARSTVDREKRRALYAEFQRLFVEDAAAILLYNPVYTYGVSNRVKNVQIGPLNTPADRFATFPQWYIVTRRVPVNQQPGP
ncbi:MAG: peptide ABC transporter substrate-binding protein [Caldilineae bacterium]|nr:MAG: peptide ABC transporter substrate-binding protein [Caldilineae bacterium]